MPSTRLLSRVRTFGGRGEHSTGTDCLVMSPREAFDSNVEGGAAPNDEPTGGAGTVEGEVTRG